MDKRIFTAFAEEFQKIATNLISSGLQLARPAAGKVLKRATLSSGNAAADFGKLKGIAPKVTQMRNSKPGLLGRLFG